MRSFMCQFTEPVGVTVPRREITIKIWAPEEDRPKRSRASRPAWAHGVNIMHCMKYSPWCLTALTVVCADLLSCGWWGHEKSGLGLRLWDETYENLRHPVPWPPVSTSLQGLACVSAEERAWALPDHHTLSSGILIWKSLPARPPSLQADSFYLPRNLSIYRSKFTELP